MLCEMGFRYFTNWFRYILSKILFLFELNEIFILSECLDLWIISYQISNFDQSAYCLKNCWLQYFFSFLASNISNTNKSGLWRENLLFIVLIYAAQNFSSRNIQISTSQMLHEVSKIKNYIDIMVCQGGAAPNKKGFLHMEI